MKKLIFSFVAAFIFAGTVTAQQVSFTMSDSTGCLPLTVTFTNTSTGTNTYQWYMDGVSYNSTNVTHTFTEPGSYYITLYGYFNGAYIGSASNIVEVMGVASEFYMSADTACPGEEVSFYYGKDANSLLWQFPDGTTSTDWGNTLSFTTGGSYNISLIVNTGCGTDTIVQTLVVDSTLIPDAFYYFFPDAACPGDVIYFGAANYNYKSYSWDFGDGTTGSSYYTTHIYTAPSTYNVTLTVTNECGNTDTHTEPVVIDNNLPIVDWASVYGPTEACPNTPLEFEVNPMVKSYLWDFGDGTTSTNPAPAHEYTATGTYTVSVILTNSCGNDTTLYHTVDINNNMEISDAYMYIDEEACPGDKLYFSAYAWPEAISYLWSFGDGNTATTQEPSHTYAATGTYPVSVTLTNGCGHDTILYDTINIHNNIPIPSWIDIYVPDEACPNDVVSFDAGGYNNSFFWTFGDGATDSVQSPQHVYTAAGIYPVSAKITNGCGNDTTLYDSINIHTNVYPDVYVDAINYEGCPGDSMLFYTDSYAASYLWSFGDGTTSTTVNEIDNLYFVNHAFTNAGSYWVTLTVTNGCGNSSKDSVEVFIANNNLGVNGYMFFDDPENGDEYQACEEIEFIAWGGQTYSWDFGDGTTGSSTSATHQYKAAGTYTVKVTVTNGCGNSATYSENITVTGTCTGIMEAASCTENHLKLYPNPAGSTASVTYFTEGGTVEVILYDMYGRSIESATFKKEEGEHTYVIDLNKNHFSNGLYLVAVKTAGKVNTARLIINK